MVLVFKFQKSNQICRVYVCFLEICLVEQAFAMCFSYLVCKRLLVWEYGKIIAFEPVADILTV